MSRPNLRGDRFIARCAELRIFRHVRDLILLCEEIEASAKSTFAMGWRLTVFVIGPDSMWWAIRSGAEGTGPLRGMASMVKPPTVLTSEMVRIGRTLSYEGDIAHIAELEKVGLPTAVAVGAHSILQQSLADHQ